MADPLEIDVHTAGGRANEPCCRHEKGDPRHPGLLVLSPTFPLGGQEVGSATVVPIQVTGDPEVRFSMVVLGDGYTAASRSGSGSTWTST
jgi:hypothetical protein